MDDTAPHLLLRQVPRDRSGGLRRGRVRLTAAFQRLRAAPGAPRPVPSRYPEVMPS